MRAHIFVSGMVQGVGYRNFVMRKAAAMGVKGWVKNLEAGHVEAVLVGEKDNVVSLIEYCKRGPPFARVIDFELRWEDGDDAFESFSIV